MRETMPVSLPFLNKSRALTKSTPSPPEARKASDLEAGAITRFRQLMNGTPRDGVRQTYVSPAAAWGLHALCLGEHPTMRYLGSLQATLTDLAKRWGC